MEGSKTTLLLMLLVVLCHGVAITIGERTSSSKSSNKLFLMQDSKSVVKADAGEMRVLESHGGRRLERLMHIGFITMEPKSLFIPQYLDSNLVIFVRRGITTFFNFLSIYAESHKECHACLSFLLKAKKMHKTGTCETPRDNPS